MKLVAPNAFILAAGLGTRLKPITDHTPKCLIPILGRPLLDYWVDVLAKVGVTEARINTHTHPEQISRYVEEVRRSGRLNLSEFYEAKLLGSAGTITANADFADPVDEVIFIYADNLSTIDLRPLLDFHRRHDDPFTILLQETATPQSCGIVEVNAEGKVLSFEEKPKNPKGNLANAGVYIVDREAYREIAAMNAFDLGFDVLPRFVGRMRGWKFDGYHRDIGTHASLQQAQVDASALFPRSLSESPKRPAVFLDRDGTLIEQVHYLSDPAQVRLVPEGAQCVRRLREAGYACVLVTNQAAVGKGLITEDDLSMIHHEMNRQLARFGAELDAIYHCPVVGSSSDRTSIDHPDRKPGPGMLLRAASELDLDLSRSWMVGDMVSDVLAGRNAGCFGSILLKVGSQSDPAGIACPAVTSLAEATQLILSTSAIRI